MGIAVADAVPLYAVFVVTTRKEIFSELACRSGACELIVVTKTLIRVVRMTTYNIFGYNSTMVVPKSLYLDLIKS